MFSNKFGRFSIDQTLFPSPILSKCVLIQSVDGFFLPTNFMYLKVSIPLSSIVSVIISSKINSVVISNKILVTSLVDKCINELMENINCKKFEYNALNSHQNYEQEALQLKDHRKCNQGLQINP